MKTLKVAALLVALSLPRAALASDLLELSRLSLPDDAFRPYRYVGDAEVTEGPLTPGTVVIRQKVAFVRTGVLRSPVAVKGWGATRRLETGTPVVLLNDRPEPVWCVLPGAYKTAVCLFEDGGQAYWIEFPGHFDDWPAYLGMPIKRRYPCSAISVEEKALPYPAEFETRIVFKGVSKSGSTGIVQTNRGLGELSMEGKNARLGPRHRRFYSADVDDPRLTGSGGVGVVIVRGADGSARGRRIGPLD